MTPSHSPLPWRAEFVPERRPLVAAWDVYSAAGEIVVSVEYEIADAAEARQVAADVALVVGMSSLVEAVGDLVRIDGQERLQAATYIGGREFESTMRRLREAHAAITKGGGQ